MCKAAAGGCACAPPLVPKLSTGLGVPWYTASRGTCGEFFPPAAAQSALTVGAHS